MDGNLRRLLVGVVLAVTALLISTPAALAAPNNGGGGEKTIGDLRKEGYTCEPAGVDTVYCTKKGSGDYVCSRQSGQCTPYVYRPPGSTGLRAGGIKAPLTPQKAVLQR